MSKLLLKSHSCFETTDVWKPCTYKNRKRSIKLYCITVSLGKFCNVQMPGSYWQLHDLNCHNYVCWSQTDTNSTSNLCGIEHVNVIEKFWLYILSKNFEVQREGVDWTFTRCCLCVTFLQQRNYVLFYSERPSFIPMQNNR
jgi:hypothetical protein